MSHLTVIARSAYLSIICANSGRKKAYDKSQLSLPSLKGNEFIREPGGGPLYLGLLLPVRGSSNMSGDLGIGYGKPEKPEKDNDAQPVQMSLPFAGARMALGRAQRRVVIPSARAPGARYGVTRAGGEHRRSTRDPG